MPQIFENPFTPPEKKPKQSLFGGAGKEKFALKGKSKERVNNVFS